MCASILSRHPEIILSQSYSERLDVVSYLVHWWRVGCRIHRAEMADALVQRHSRPEVRGRPEGVGDVNPKRKAEQTAVQQHAGKMMREKKSTMILPHHFARFRTLPTLATIFS
jgi:hypothetical protein